MCFYSLAKSARMDALALRRGRPINFLEKNMEMAPTNKAAGERMDAVRSRPPEALRWDWYALLRLIQAEAEHQPPIGHGIQLTHDPVRLGQPPFMHPPQTSVASFRMQGPHEAGAAAYAKRGVPWVNSFHFGL